MFYRETGQLLLRLGVDKYEVFSLWLFIDSLKCSLNCALLHNIKMYASIPIGHSPTPKEKYELIKQVMESIN